MDSSLQNNKTLPAFKSAWDLKKLFGAVPWMKTQTDLKVGDIN